MSRSSAELNLMALKCHYSSNRAVLESVARFREQWDGLSVPEEESRVAAEQKLPLDQQLGEEMEFALRQEVKTASLGADELKTGENPWSLMWELEDEFRSILKRAEAPDDDPVVVGLDGTDSDILLPEAATAAARGDLPGSGGPTDSAQPHACRWQREALRLREELAASQANEWRAAAQRSAALRAEAAVRMEAEALAGRLQEYQALARDVEAFRARYSACFALLHQQSEAEIDRHLGKGRIRGTPRVPAAALDRSVDVPETRPRSLTSAPMRPTKEHKELRDAVRTLSAQLERRVEENERMSVELRKLRAWKAKVLERSKLNRQQRSERDHLRQAVLARATRP